MEIVYYIWYARDICDKMIFWQRMDDFGGKWMILRKRMCIKNDFFINTGRKRFMIYLIWPGR